MFDALSRRQGLRALLREDELASLTEAAVERRVNARGDVFAEGGGGEYVHIVLEGWVARYRDLANGTRQHIALHLPGDVCDLDRVMLGAVDFGAAALTSCRVARISLPDLQGVFDAKPRLAMVFWWMLSAENAMACAWASSLCQKTAQERLAHLLCEIAVRLSEPAPADGATYPLRMTQEDLANALGLSVVHANRSLQSLRAEGVIEVANRQLRIVDWGRLCRIAEFDPAYLHREGPKGARSYGAGLADAAAEAAALADLRDREAADLRRRLQRREVELRELNHRIANSLQIASGLLRRQWKILGDPQGREALAEAQTRLEAVGKLHRYLYLHSDDSTVDLKTFLEALCPDIASSTNLGCLIEADSVAVPADLAQQLGIVVNELAMNARKHAYQDGVHGELRVECRTGPDRLVLTVADNGPGLGEGFDLSQESGLGMTLLRGITAQLDGRLAVEDRHGARFTLDMPWPAPRPPSTADVAWRAER
jgi:two-component sensor histidine kinase/CRP-like cAMP-binding protein